MAEHPNTVRELSFLGAGFLAGVVLTGGAASVYLVPHDLWPKWSVDHGVYVAEGLAAADRRRALEEEIARLKKVADEATAAKATAEGSLAATSAKLSDTQAKLTRALNDLKSKSATPRLPPPREPEMIFLRKNSAEIVFGDVVLTWLAASDTSCQFRIEDSGGQRGVRLTTGNSAPLASQSGKARLTLRSVETSETMAGTCYLLMTKEDMARR